MEKSTPFVRLVKQFTSHITQSVYIFRSERKIGIERIDCRSCFFALYSVKSYLNHESVPLDDSPPWIRLRSQDPLPPFPFLFQLLRPPVLRRARVPPPFSFHRNVTSPFSSRPSVLSRQRQSLLGRVAHSDTRRVLRHSEPTGSAPHFANGVTTFRSVRARVHYDQELNVWLYTLLLPEVERPNAPPLGIFIGASMR